MEAAALDLRDPRRIVRWVYVGRLTLAFAIFLAAVLAWLRASSTNTLIASLAFAGAMVFTVASAIWSEVWERPMGRTFLYLQSLVDLALVTAVVHVTGGPSSQFAATYVLVIAVAALLLPVGGGLLVAVLGNVLYAADTLTQVGDLGERAVWLQLGVFAVVALGSAAIAERLRRASTGSERLAAELVQVRLQAEDVLRAIESGILTVDRAGHLLYGNPAAARLLGMPLEPWLGRPVLPAIAERAPALAAALERTARDRVRVTRGEGAIAYGGLANPVGVTTTFAGGEGDTAEFSATAIFQDISDQKRMEQLQVRTQRLEAVTALGASLAHEIKNPLAVIRSAVEQLARRTAADADERTLAGLITRETDRVARILSEFLDFTRVRVARFARVDGAAVARNAAELAGGHPERAEGVTVAVEAPAAPAWLEADEDLLHRAVFNLTLNAVQASPPGGTVTVGVARLDAAALPSGLPATGPHVRFTVRDEGPGLPASVRERLFEPFQTTRPSGTGLGLPMVHRAVEAHRGQVTVETGPDGTRFTIYVPVAPRDPATA
jgi:two-component system sensor histidine kinase PilS (NtrC family)